MPKETRRQKTERKQRELIRLIAMVVDELAAERCRRQQAEAAVAEQQKAAELAQYRGDVARECAKLAGFPKSFGTRLHRHMSVGELAYVFRDAARLPKM
jgi:hypothetical protein